MNSLPALIREVANRGPDRPALLRKQEDGGLAATSHGDFQATIRQAAAGWVAAGLQPGEAVVLLSENRPAWLLADLAIQSAGAVTVPLYPSLPAEQVEPLVAQVRARFAVVENAAQYAKLQARRAALPALERVYLLDPDGPTDSSLPCASWEDLLAEGNRRERDLGEEVERRVAALTPDDLATIIFTSGTTGEPKGAMLSHGNLVSNIVGCQEVLGLRTDDVALVVLPQSHVFQRTLTYLTLHAGASLLFNENMRHLLADLGLVRPTLLCVVPRMLEMIRERVTAGLCQRQGAEAEQVAAALAVAERRTAAFERREAPSPSLAAAWEQADAGLFGPLRRQLGLDRARFLISGGAALPPDLGRWFYGLGLKVTQGYGLTETSPVVAVNDPNGWVRFDTIGPPLSNAEVTLAPDGELLTRGPAVMKGYFEKPEETAEVIDPEGWFHTGDLAEWTEEGHLRIVDRKKNILVLANGKNVAPALVESRLLSSSLIAQAVVLGDGQDVVTALIVPATEALAAALSDAGAAVERDAGGAWLQRPEVERLVRAEIERVSQGLAPYEMVRRFRLIPNDFSLEREELTPTLKPRRRKIVEHYAELVREMAGLGGR